MTSPQSRTLIEAPLNQEFVHLRLSLPLPTEQICQPIDETVDPFQKLPIALCINTAEVPQTICEDVQRLRGKKRM